jgi:hypothetical protein
MFLLLTGSRGTACAKFVVLIVSVVALKSSWTSVQFLTRASKNKSGTLPQMSALGQERRIGAVRNISALPPRADVGADIV